MPESWVPGAWCRSEDIDSSPPREGAQLEEAQVGSCLAHSISFLLHPGRALGSQEGKRFKKEVIKYVKAAQRSSQRGFVVLDLGT